MGATRLDIVVAGVGSSKLQEENNEGFGNHGRQSLSCWMNYGVASEGLRNFASRPIPVELAGYYSNLFEGYFLEILNSNATRKAGGGK